MVLILAYRGLRFGELTGLNVEAVDVDARRIRVRRSPHRRVGFRDPEWATEAKSPFELQKCWWPGPGSNRRPSAFQADFWLTQVYFSYKVVLNHRVGRPGVPGPVVWPHFGPIEASGATADGLGGGTAGLPSRATVSAVGAN